MKADPHDNIWMNYEIQTKTQYVYRQIHIFIMALTLRRVSQIHSPLPLPRWFHFCCRNPSECEQREQMSSLRRVVVVWTVHTQKKTEQALVCSTPSMVRWRWKTQGSILYAFCWSRRTSETHLAEDVQAAGFSMCPVISVEFVIVTFSVFMYAVIQWCFWSLL